jgi:hypothetical protein
VHDAAGPSSGPAAVAGGSGCADDASGATDTSEVGRKGESAAVLLDAPLGDLTTLLETIDELTLELQGFGVD